MDTQRKQVIAVVGAGLAGHVAALTAVDLAIEAGVTASNLSVLLIEKNAFVGGNSMKASSGINAVNTPHQIAYLEQNEPEKKHSMTEEWVLFSQDTLKSHLSSEESLYSDASAAPTKMTKTSYELILSLVGQSTQAIEFIESHGNLPLPKISQLGGHSSPRTHRPLKGSVGAEIIKSLTNAVKSEKYSEYISLILGTTLKAVNTGDDDVIQSLTVDSVDPATKEVASREIMVDALILTTGGFAANNDLIKKYNPQLGGLNLPTTNGPWARGEAFSMVEKLGGTVIGADKIQVHPTSFVDPANRESLTKFLAPEAFRGVGGLLFNSSGRRFVNELATRDAVSKHIYDQPGHVAALVMSKQSAEEFGLPILNFYISKGFVKVARVKADLDGDGDGDLSTLAETIKEMVGADTMVDASTLRAELDNYQAAFHGTNPEKFGKSVFHQADTYSTTGTDEFYVMAVTPALHYTMGGVEIDTDCRVLKTLKTVGDVNAGATKQVIPKLYAAGECAGGVHGNNRLGGNSLLECVVFGMFASQAAFSDVFSLQPTLSKVDLSNLSIYENEKDLQ